MAAFLGRRTLWTRFAPANRVGQQRVCNRHLVTGVARGLDEDLQMFATGKVWVLHPVGESHHALPWPRAERPLQNVFLEAFSSGPARCQGCRLGDARAAYEGRVAESSREKAAWMQRAIGRFGDRPEVTELARSLADAQFSAQEWQRFVRFARPQPHAEIVEVGIRRQGLRHGPVELSRTPVWVSVGSYPTAEWEENSPGGSSHLWLADDGEFWIGAAAPRATPVATLTTRPEHRSQVTGTVGHLLREYRYGVPVGAPLDVRRVKERGSHPDFWLWPIAVLVEEAARADIMHAGA